MWPRTEGHVEPVDVVGVLGHAVRLAHEEVDEHVGQHVVAGLAHHVNRRVDLALPALSVHDTWAVSHTSGTPGLAWPSHAAHLQEEFEGSGILPAQGVEAARLAEVLPCLVVVRHVAGVVRRDVVP